jgi:hypothetical protein
MSDSGEWFGGMLTANFMAFFSEYARSATPARHWPAVMLGDDHDCGIFAIRFSKFFVSDSLAYGWRRGIIQWDAKQ